MSLGSFRTMAEQRELMKGWVLEEREVPGGGGGEGGGGRWVVGAESEEQEGRKDVLGLPGWETVKVVPGLLVGT